MPFKFNPFTGNLDYYESGSSDGVTIGTTVFTGGTQGSVLFVGSGGIIQQDNTNLFWDDTINQLNIRNEDNVTGFSEYPLIIGGNTSAYLSTYIRNKNAGVAASSDYIAGADNDSTELTGHYIDMGIWSSGFTAEDTGNVQTVSIHTAGTGYTVGDVLTLTGGDNNCTVTVITVSAGAVTAVSISNNGSSYTVANEYATTGGTGSGCKINVTALFDQSLFSANSGYLFTSGGDMSLGTDTNTKILKLFVGGFGGINEKMRITTNSVGVLNNNPQKSLHIGARGDTSIPLSNPATLALGGTTATNFAVISGGTSGSVPALYFKPDVSQAASAGEGIMYTNYAAFGTGDYYFLGIPTSHTAGYTVWEGYDNVGTVFSNYSFQAGRGEIIFAPQRTEAIRITPTGALRISGLTASRAVVTDGSKDLVSSAVTATELGYVSGVTSAIQTQLNTKGTFTLPSLTAGSVLFSDGSTIAQDNANFFYDDTNNILELGARSTYDNDTLFAKSLSSLRVAASFEGFAGQTSQSIVNFHNNAGTVVAKVNNLGAINGSDVAVTGTNACASFEIDGVGAAMYFFPGDVAVTAVLRNPGDGRWSFRNGGETAKVELVTTTDAVLKLRNHGNSADAAITASAGTFSTDVEIDGALNHDGTTVGFYGVAPATQATTIADADGTLADVTTKFNSLLAKLETLGLLASA